MMLLTFGAGLAGLCMAYLAMRDGPSKERATMEFFRGVAIALPISLVCWLPLIWLLFF